MCKTEVKAGVQLKNFLFLNSILLHDSGGSQGLSKVKNSGKEERNISFIIGICRLLSVVFK